MFVCESGMYACAQISHATCTLLELFLSSGVGWPVDTLRLLL